MENVKSPGMGRKILSFFKGLEEWIELVVFFGIVVYFVIFYVVPFLVRLFYLLNN